MTAHQQVRVVLTEHRHRGTSFEEAWLSALRSLPRKANLEADIGALLWAKPHWRAAYLRTPIEKHALAALERAGATQTFQTTKESPEHLGSADELLRAA